MFNFFKDLRDRHLIISMWVPMLISLALSMMIGVIFKFSITQIVLIVFISSVSSLVGAYNVYSDGYDSLFWKKGHAVTLVTAEAILICYALLSKSLFISIIAILVAICNILYCRCCPYLYINSTRGGGLNTFSSFFFI